MNTEKTIFNWLDDIFSREIPEEVEAIYINLVECNDVVDVEFFGIGNFDPNDIDWACNDIFNTESIEVPFREMFQTIGNSHLRIYQILSVSIYARNMT